MFSDQRERIETNRAAARIGWRPSRPEILDAYSRDGHYFASIRLARDADDRVFELGISASSYTALRRVIQTRPFDQMPGLPRRCFFVPSYSKRDDPQRCIGTVRIEQGRDGKNVQFEMPADLIANLLWFYEMKTLASAKHLRSWLPSETQEEGTPLLASNKETHFMQRSTWKLMVCCVFALWLLGNIWARKIAFGNATIATIGIPFVILSNPIFLTGFAFVIARSKSIGFAIAIPIIFLTIWIGTPPIAAALLFGHQVIERFLVQQFSVGTFVYWGVCMLTYSSGLYCGWKKNEVVNGSP